jgi:hypothetical protein
VLFECCVAFVTDGFLMGVGQSFKLLSTFHSMLAAD